MINSTNSLSFVIESGFVEWDGRWRWDAPIGSIVKCAHSLILSLKKNKNNVHKTNYDRGAKGLLLFIMILSI